MNKDEALSLAIKALKTIDEAMPFPVAKLAIIECESALKANNDPILDVLYWLMQEYEEGDGEIPDGLYTAARKAVIGYKNT